MIFWILQSRLTPRSTCIREQEEEDEDRMHIANTLDEIKMNGMYSLMWSYGCAPFLSLCVYGSASAFLYVYALKMHSNLFRSSQLTEQYNFQRYRSMLISFESKPNEKRIVCILNPDHNRLPFTICWMHNIYKL